MNSNHGKKATQGISDQIAAGRQVVRDRGAEKVLNIIRRCVAPAPLGALPLQIHDDQREVSGRIEELTPAQLRDWFAAQGSIVQPDKNQQPLLVLDLGRDARKRKEDVLSRQILFLDHDKKAPSVDRYVELLGPLGMAFIAHQSWSHTDDAPRTHGLLFLAEPLVFAEDRDVDAVRLEQAYVGGVFAELLDAELDASHGTPGRLIYAGNRPSDTATARRVVGADGGGLRWDHLLEGLGFEAPVDLQLEAPDDEEKDPLPSVEELKDKHSKAERLRRFKTYLEFAPPSYPGMPPRGAGAHVLYLARVGVRGFLLDERDVVQTMLGSSWNKRCHNGKEGKKQQPDPWTRPDLEHKARDAARDNFDKPPGWCLLEDKKDKEPADSDEEWPDFCDLDCAFEWLNARFAFVMVGATAAIYDEKHDRVLLPAQFKQMMSPLRVDVANKKGDAVSKPAAALWLDSKARRSYDRLVFRPDYSKAECESKKVLNRWRGFTVKPSENGSWSLLRDHILTNVCSGDEAQFQWVMQWFALLFQKPGYTKKPGTALVLRSRSRGTGKGVVGKHIGKLLGAGYMLVDDPEKILGKFNEHLQTTLLVHLDDSENKDLRDNAGILRSRITSDTLNIERKGVDVEKNVPNHMRLFMNTNDEWAVPAGEDERRFCVIDMPSHEHTQKRPYFAEIERQLLEAGDSGYQRLLHDLLHWPITLDVGVVPKNAALAKQKLFSLHPIDKWLLHSARGRQLVTGSKPYSLAPSKTAEPKDWVKVERDELREAFRYYAASIGMKTGVDPERFGARLRDIIGEHVDCWLSSGATKKRGYRVPPYSVLLERFAKRLNVTVEQLDAAPAEDPTEGQGAARDDAHAALTN